MTRVLILVFVVTVLSSCGGGGSEKNSPVPVIPLFVPKPTNVVATPTDGVITIAWGSDFESASFDIYLSTEDNLQAETYSTFEGSEWIRDVTSPYEYIPQNLRYRYFYTIVAKASGVESGQSDIVSAVPRYIDGGESVEDLYTNLIWLKCSIGQAYNPASNSCDGEPSRVSHDEVQALIGNSYPDWRLPTLSEAISLVYCVSGRPNYFHSLEDNEQVCDRDEFTDNATIYPSMFPNTLITDTSAYRTSTPKIVFGFENFRFYYTLNMGTGGISQSGGNEPVKYHARLVKSR
jgi:hypothetical protein